MAAVEKSRRVTATKPGYAIGHTAPDADPLQLRLTPLPVADNPDYQWIDPTPNRAQPGRCGNCHAEIHREWSDSAHAGSATNPRVLRAFTQAALDRPGDTGVCARCHAPTMRDPDIDYDLRTAAGIDRLGVHCDYCHKVAEAPKDKFGTRFGSDALQLLRPPNGQALFWGPLPDAVREGEMFAYSPAYKDSRYCASCHEGVIYGIHVYGTYSEWLESPARLRRQECQSCHMAPTGKMTNIAPGNGGVERDPRTLASHSTFGATVEMLKRCLSVGVSIEDNRVQVDLTADQVGHRVPTGFPEHHLILLVRAYEAGSQVESDQVAGPRLPASLSRQRQGMGLAGKVFAKQFMDARSGRPLPFWLAREEPLDTRLYPEKTDRTRFVFRNKVTRVRIQLVYRRVWTDLAVGLRGDVVVPEQGDISIIDQIFVGSSQAENH
jgi:hypothetical protein